MSLEQRVLKLERNARIWRSVCFGLAVLLVGGAAVRQDKPGPLECTSLRVADEKSDAVVTIDFKDLAGSRYAVFGITPGNGGLDGRFGIAVCDTSMVINGPQLMLAHSKQDRVWQGNIGNLNLRNSWMFYEESSSVTRSVFGVRDGRAMMELMNAEGQPAVMATTIPSKADPKGDHTGGMVVVMQGGEKESRSFLTPKID